MPKLKFKGKILFIFSDPGGAKPCLALASTFDLKDVLAVSDRDYTFYRDFNCRVIKPDDGISHIIDQFKPDLIFTGTSYTSSIEKEAISLARAQSINCWSFVDHWTSISARFIYNGEANLPDKIWVIDEKAKAIAIDEGINEERIIISGNPYHKWLASWKPTITKADFFGEISITDISKKIIVYAPDPLSNVNGLINYGFDEISSSLAIVKIFDQLYEQSELNWLVLVKMHPNQNKTIITDIFSNKPYCKILTADVDVNKTIFFSDMVLGFFSSFLLEAQIMNKKVIRFLVTQTINDPFGTFDVGTKVDENSLLPQIVNILSGNE